MKKLGLSFLCMVCLMASMYTTAFADVIIEPEDDFYMSHGEECEYIDRVYIAAGANGVTKVYESPEDATVLTEVPNGEEIRLTYQWNDWFYYHNADMGWVHSDDVSLKYDHTSFLADHQATDHENTNYSVPMVQMYTYPNSGDCYEMTESIDYATIGESFSKGYVDDAGLQWGYIGYYMQHNGWVCVDDPMNKSLASGFVAVEESVSQIRGTDAVVKTSMGYLPIATVLVVVLVGTTAVLLIRKKK